MSWEASTFVLGIKVGSAAKKLVLLGYANHAHKDGSNAWPSVATVADYAECDSRTVRRHVAWLVENGFMREGDQKLVASLPHYSRPVVYDLAMSVEQIAEWKAAYERGERGDARSKAAEIGAAGGKASAQVRWGDKQSPGENLSGDGGDTLSPGTDKSSPGNGAAPPDTGVSTPLTELRQYPPDKALSPEPSVEPSVEPPSTRSSLRSEHAADHAEAKQPSQNSHAEPTATDVADAEATGEVTALAGDLDQGTIEGAPQPPRHKSQRGQQNPEAYDAAKAGADWWHQECQRRGIPIMKRGRSNPYVALRDHVLYPAFEAGFDKYEVAAALQALGDPLPAWKAFEHALQEARGLRSANGRGPASNVHRDRAEAVSTDTSGMFA